MALVHTGANEHDSEQAIPLIDAIPPIKRPGGGRRKRPAKAYADRAYDAEAKIRLSKLAWDATGTQFGQRQLQYERYYAGDPMRTGASIYTMQKYDSLLAMP